MKRKMEISKEEIDKEERERRRIITDMLERGSSAGREPTGC